MTRIKCAALFMLMLNLVFIGGGCKQQSAGHRFDQLVRTVDLANWQFGLRVENQNEQKGNAIAGLDGQYLKATLSLSNGVTKKSMLYSLSKDKEDYEKNYTYLSFGSNRNLYIKLGSELIYPIGYVFEPSNGLSTSERLVYKFHIREELYRQMVKNGSAVEYWYVDNLAGLGKICFKQQQLL